MMEKESTRQTWSKENGKSGKLKLRLGDFSSPSSAIPLGNGQADRHKMNIIRKGPRSTGYLRFGQCPLC